VARLDVGRVHLAQDALDRHSSQPAPRRQAARHRSIPTPPIRFRIRQVVRLRGEHDTFTLESGKESRR
jgi:hypothetical protein